MEHLNNNGYSSSYRPKRDSSTVTNRYTENDTELANIVYLDALNDLKRWCDNAKSEIEGYVKYSRKYQATGNERYKELTSDIRSFLVDMRKGVDWFKINYDKTPSFLKDFQNYISCRKDRLIILKKYLSTRVRRFTALNYINNTQYDLSITKLLQDKIKYELKVLDIFVSKDRRYVKRKTIEEIINGGVE
jgi:hypothetical protein